VFKNFLFEESQKVANCVIGNSRTDEATFTRSCIIWWYKERDFWHG